MDLIKINPRLDVHPSQPVRSPGEVLLHAYMTPNALNPAQLARRTGIPSTRIKAYIAGTRAINANNAIRLALILGTTAFYWLALQARYDLDRERQTRRVSPPLVK